MFSAAADFEWRRVAFTTVIGDAARAEGRLGMGRELGVQMPFEFSGLRLRGRWWVGGWQSGGGALLTTGYRPASLQDAISWGVDPVVALR